MVSSRGRPRRGADRSGDRLLLEERRHGGRPTCGARASISGVFLAESHLAGWPRRARSRPRSQRGESPRDGRTRGGVPVDRAGRRKRDALDRVRCERDGGRGRGRVRHNRRRGMEGRGAGDREADVCREPALAAGRARPSRATSDRGGARASGGSEGPDDGGRGAGRRVRGCRVEATMRGGVTRGGERRVRAEQRWREGFAAGSGEAGERSRALKNCPELHSGWVLQARRSRAPAGWGQGLAPGCRDWRMWPPSQHQLLGRCAPAGASPPRRPSCGAVTLRQDGPDVRDRHSVAPRGFQEEEARRELPRGYRRCRLPCGRKQAPQNRRQGGR